jgi:hypothetical protein
MRFLIAGSPPNASFQALQPFAPRRYVPTMLLDTTYVPDIHAAALNHPGADLELPPTCLLVYDRDVVPKRFDYSTCSCHTRRTRVTLRLRSDVQIFVKTLITNTIALDDGRLLSSWFMTARLFLSASTTASAHDIRCARASSFAFSVACRPSRRRSALAFFANLQGQTVVLEVESSFQARGAPTRFHPASLVARSTLPSSLLPDVSFKPSLQPSLKELKHAPSVAAMQKPWEETSLLLSGCMFLPCYLRSLRP